MLERLRIANQYRKVTAGRRHSLAENIHEFRAGWHVARFDLDGGPDE